MIDAMSRPGRLTAEPLPLELLELRARVQSQPEEVRAELEPLVEDILEQARFRNRVLSVARGALEQFKLDLELTRFDLDATKREREALTRLLEGKKEDRR